MASKIVGSDEECKRQGDVMWAKEATLVKSALVLGGGGVAGIAWMTGMLLGLERLGMPLRKADRLIGTSAGAAVAAQLAGELTLEALYQRQTDPTLQVKELTPDPQVLAAANDFFQSLPELMDAEERIRRIGQAALSLPKIDPALRHAVIAARVSSHHWPDRDLVITAIDLQTGELALFDRNLDISLVDAVAASCAVPGIWPPVPINGRRYYDGGVQSPDNADLALGCSAVIVLSMTGMNEPLLIGPLPEQVAMLRRAGAHVCVIEPDPAARAAIGNDPLAPESRAPAARAGLLQAPAFLKQARAVWPVH